MIRRSGSQPSPRLRCRRPLARLAETALLVGGLAGCGAGGTADRPAESSAPSLLISRATVVDGSGAPGRVLDVRIRGERIAEIGELAPEPGEPAIAADGLVLAPGFIDAHSHADEALFEHPEALAAVSQGITTLVIGQDGESPSPLAEFFARLQGSPVAVNLASFAGHGTLRRQVMASDYRRPAAAGEVAAMAELLARDLEAGALGLSSGLEYDPGLYAATSELVALARIAAAVGGRYISHVRSEDRRFWQAIDEAIAIGREAGLPVQISHLKLAMRSLHGETGRLLATLEQARRSGVEVSADLYPYTYWQSTLTVMFPDRDFESLPSATFAVEELASADSMLLARFDPDPSLAGMTLAAIADRRGVEPAEALIELIREAESLRRSLPPERRHETLESVIATSMAEADLERLMAWPHLVFCTDGELAGSHPRGFGTFSRILGRYVRERRVLSLEEAVRRMTSAAASSLGIPERGLIEPGAAADLVLFDPATVGDRATTEDPRALSAGIERVWVAGEPVYSGGRVTGRRPGRVLRRGAGATPLAGAGGRGMLLGSTPVSTEAAPGAAADANPPTPALRASGSGP